MKCDEAKGIIQLYLDNELESRCTMDVRHHLDSCIHCSRLLDIYAEQDRVLKQSALAEIVDGSRVREKIRTLIEKETSRAGRSWWSRPLLRRVAVLLAAAAIAGILLLRGALGPSTNTSAYADAIQDHLYHCWMESGLGITTDSDQIGKLVSEYGGVRSIPDVSSFGYTRVNGALCDVEGIHYFHLVFRGTDRGAERTPLSIFLRSGSNKPATNGFSMFHDQGVTICSFSKSGVEVLILSALDDGTTSAIAHAIGDQVESMHGLNPALEAGKLVGRKDRTPVRILDVLDPRREAAPAAFLASQPE